MSNEALSTTTPPPDLDTPGTIIVPMYFSPGALSALRSRGFLGPGPASVGNIEVAVFKMLRVAYEAGVRAPEAAAPTPPAPVPPPRPATPSPPVAR
jgi:hypothetical protein